MKHKLINGLGYLSIVLLCLTLLCGGWVATHKDSDKSFHGKLAGVSVVVTIISQTINLCKCRNCQKSN